jgi:hypothetical protein
MIRAIRTRAALIAAAVALALAGCATPTLPPPAAGAAAVQRGGLDAAAEARILALDPERVSDADIRQTLARAPAPRIVLLHGGVYPVHLLMENFAVFLAGMGYPQERIRRADGTLSWSPYENPERQAGEIAWYYEREDGARPIFVGHSQGGIQAVKLAQELAGWFDPAIRVVNPGNPDSESRTWVTDPLTGREQPVVGLGVACVAVIGTGGWSLALPVHWNVWPRIRTVPDNVVSFTGYRIGVDLFAWDAPGLEGLKTFHPAGKAEVRNVTLPAGLSHVFVPDTAELIDNPSARAWINAFAPKGEDVGQDPPEFAHRNIVWAADVWWNVKKHWVLEAQRVIKARRAKLAAAPAPATKAQ